jgi:hypothetical protein
MIREGPSRLILSEDERIEALNEVAYRMGYNPDQERGFVPILVFITDEQYADVKHLGYDANKYLSDYLNRAIDCAGGLVDNDAGGER